MVTTGILTISSASGRFNHRFVGDRSSAVFQLPAIGEWLQWCKRYKHPLEVDSFLSFVHQLDSSMLHRLTGVTPPFGADTVAGMKAHYAPFLKAGSVQNVFHIDVFGEQFNSVTHLQRLVKGSKAVWVDQAWTSLESIHNEAAFLCREAARETRAEGYTAWQVDPEGAALDFEDTAARHVEFLRGRVCV